jgi:hypothetical protein
MNNADFTAVFDIYPFIAGNLTSQNFEVWVNEAKVADWSIIPT